MDDVFTYIIVVCNDKTSVKSAQHVTHQKGLHATVAFMLEYRGVNIVASTLKPQNSVADINIPVTVIPCMLSQSPVFLSQR